MARLRDAVAWIALEDCPEDPEAAGDRKAVAASAPVRMVAALWGKTPRDIAERVVGLRSLEGLAGAPPSWEELWVDLDTDKRRRRK